jgi:hypothetical protein
VCGIIASISKAPTRDNAVKVKKQYLEQKNRGTEGYGFVGVDENNKVIHIRATQEGEILAELDRLPPMKTIIFHHRIPTCNMNAVAANHPLFITSKKNLEHKYFIVHNGMISNSGTLREYHEKEGFRYRSTIDWFYKDDEKKIYSEHTDTESLGIELAKLIEQKSSHLKCKGGAAVFMLEIDKKNNPLNFYAFRQTNPIKWFRNQNGIFLASEAKGAELDDRKIFRINLETLKVTTRPAELATYSHIGTEYQDKDYEVLPDGGFINLEKKSTLPPLVAHISAYAKPTETQPATATHLVTHHGGSMRGNTLILPVAPINPIGFHRLKKGSPLSQSLRTYESVQRELTNVNDILYDLDAELFEFEENEGKGVEIDTEYLWNLKQRHKAFLKMQEEITLEIEILTPMTNHA